MCPTGDGCTSDATYLLCVNEVHRDLITTTAAISALSSFLMGLFANLPVGLAPGLGLNAYVRALSCYQTFHVALTCAKVYLFHRRLPWDRNRHLQGGTRRGFHGRVRNSTTPWGNEKFIRAFRTDGFSSSCHCSVFVNGSFASCHSLSSSLSELV